jgi:hypothetical protein
MVTLSIGHEGSNGTYSLYDRVHKTGIAMVDEAGGKAVVCRLEEKGQFSQGMWNYK